MKTLKLASIALVAFSWLPQVALADCASDVRIHLEWCSRNHDVNEGATCGLHALAGVNIKLPLDAGQAILGNTWDRTNMMGATVSAYKVGAKSQAIEAAVCCQIHNRVPHECLISRKDLVEAWLKTK